MNKQTTLGKLNKKNIWMDLVHNGGGGGVGGFGPSPLFTFFLLLM